jgi:hypothetical protein
VSYWLNTTAEDEAELLPKLKQGRPVAFEAFLPRLHPAAGANHLLAVRGWKTTPGGRLEVKGEDVEEAM